jgi:hypothetical protein
MAAKSKKKARIMLSLKYLKQQGKMLEDLVEVHRKMLLGFHGLGNTCDVFIDDDPDCPPPPPNGKRKRR